MFSCWRKVDNCQYKLFAHHNYSSYADIIPKPFIPKLERTKLQFHRLRYWIETLFLRTLRHNNSNSTEKSERCFAFSIEYVTFAVTYWIHGKCSLFSSDERRKFDRRENRWTSYRVISIRGYRRGAVAYLSSRFPTTCLTKISFQHHAFCLFKSKK